MSGSRDFPSGVGTQMMMASASLSTPASVVMDSRRAATRVVRSSLPTSSTGLSPALSRAPRLFLAPILRDLVQRLPQGVRDGVDLGVREFREARQRQDLARGLPGARALRLRPDRPAAPGER